MKTTLFKGLCGIVALYHIILGFSGLVLPTEALMRVSELILGLQPELNAQFELTSKFASAYVLTFGILALMLAKNPQKHRALAIPVLTLFGIRLINKIIFFGQIESTFEVPLARSIFGVTCIAVFFFGILFTLPKKDAP